MNSFHLIIVTPDGPRYDGQATRLTVRTTEGEVTILARHIDYAAAIGMGPASIGLEDGTVRTAACIGGFLGVSEGEVRLIASTFEWKENINVERSKRSLKRAEDKLADPSLSPEERKIYSARRKRALVRIGLMQEENS